MCGKERRTAMAGKMVLAATGLSAMFAGFPASASERVSVEGFGASVSADGEVSAARALPRGPSWARNWRMEVRASGGAGVHVEAALGAGVNGDGILEDGEVTAALGWDRGVWFILGGEGLGERWTAPSSAPSGGTLAMDVRVRADGSASAVSFRDGGGEVAFAGLPEAPAWLSPPGWGAARLTARGTGGRGEGFSCAVFADGSLLILK